MIKMIREQRNGKKTRDRVTSSLSYNNNNSNKKKAAPTYLQQKQIKSGAKRGVVRAKRKVMMNEYNDVFGVSQIQLFRKGCKWMSGAWKWEGWCLKTTAKSLLALGYRSFCVYLSVCFALNACLYSSTFSFFFLSAFSLTTSFLFGKYKKGEDRKKGGKRSAREKAKKKNRAERWRKRRSFVSQKHKKNVKHCAQPGGGWVGWTNETETNNWKEEEEEQS